MKTQVKHNVELMAPVGSFESLHAAINAGCDSIFFGVTQLNMRARSADNLDIEDLAEVARICQDKKVRTYLTVNTLLYDHDIKLASKLIDAAKANGIDSVICADMAAILYANSIDMPVHISTQLSIANIEAVKFYAQYSDMIVLARELTLSMVKRICDEVKKQDIRGRSGHPLKIEIFGHGALCIAISGRCSMSLLTDNSSANRGACRQNCRRSYKVIDEETQSELRLENDFVMSPTDLCTIGLLDELVDTGVAVLKIEGRGRSADYVDRVIRTYREALDALNEGTFSADKIKVWNEQLGTVFNRGMSHSFYLGKPFVEWSGVYGNKATKQRVLLGVVRKYYAKIGVSEIELQAETLEQGAEIQIVGDTTGIVRGSADEIWLAEKIVSSAKKGDVISLKLEGKVRPGDRFYKVIDSK